jgi:hypothetical protein
MLLGLAASSPISTTVGTGSGTVCHGKEGVVSLLYFLLFSVYYAWSIAPTGEGPFWYKAILWLIIAGEAIIQIRMVFIGFKAQRALCD